jgi:hypothetical protein
MAVVAVAEAVATRAEVLPVAATRAILPAPATPAISPLAAISPGMAVVAGQVTAGTAAAA